MVPLYLRHIPVDMYGAWLASGNILFWLSSFDMGISAVIVQRVGSAYGRRDITAIGGFATAGILICAFLGLLVITAGALAAPYVPNLVQLSEASGASNLSKAFMIAAIGSGLSALGFGIQGANSGLQESFSIGLVSVLAQLSALIATLMGILMGYGVYALAIGILVRPLIDILGNVIILYKRKRVDSIDFSLSKLYIVDISKMLGFTSLGKAGVAISDRIDGFLLARFLGPETVPIYMLTRRGMDIVKHIFIRPGNALVPTISHLMGEGKTARGKEIMIRFITILIWASGLSTVGFILLNHQFISLWVGEDLYAGNGVNLALVSVLALGILGLNLGLICKAMGDIVNMAITSVTRAVVVAALMIPGIYFFGIIGAATAPIGGFILVYLPYALISFHKHLKFNLKDWTKLSIQVIHTGVSIISLILIVPLVEADNWIRFAQNVVVVTTTFFILLCLLSSTLRSEAKISVRTIRHIVQKIILNTNARTTKNS